MIVIVIAVAVDAVGTVVVVLGSLDVASVFLVVGTRWPSSKDSMMKKMDDTKKYDTCMPKMVCKGTPGMLFGWWLVLILELQIVSCKLSCKHYSTRI